jgi:hypothetical protein
MVILEISLPEPLILKQCLTAVKYLHFLMNELPLLMEDMLLEAVLKIFFEHDGSSEKFINRIIAYLNQHYKTWWIGHAGSVLWLLKAVH